MKAWLSAHVWGRKRQLNPERCQRVRRQITRHFQTMRTAYKGLSFAPRGMMRQGRADDTGTLRPRSPFDHRMNYKKSLENLLTQSHPCHRLPRGISDLIVTENTKQTDKCLLLIQIFITKVEIRKKNWFFEKYNFSPVCLKKRNWKEKEYRIERSSAF